MLKPIILSIAFYIMVFVSLNAQEKPDSIIFQEKMELCGLKGARSKVDVFLQFGKSFIGTPYEAATLETDGAENLIVNLRELDCTTFIESCLALTNTYFTEKNNFETFQQKLITIRYRNGRLEGYASRLHYFSEWIDDNASKGFVEDVTQRLGGIPCPIKLNFMSTHPQFYRQLKADSALIATIAQQEEYISKKEFYYISKEMVAQMESQLEEGMIVGITSSKSGLDIAHTGMLVKQNGRIHLLHASSEYKQVVISEKPLVDYLMGNKTQTGIMVLEIK